MMESTLTQINKCCRSVFFMFVNVNQFTNVNKLNFIVFSKNYYKMSDLTGLNIKFLVFNFSLRFQVSLTETFKFTNAHQYKTKSTLPCLHSVSLLIYCQSDERTVIVHNNRKTQTEHSVSKSSYLYVKSIFQHETAHVAC